MLVFRLFRSGCDIMLVGMPGAIVAGMGMRIRGLAGMMRNAGQRMPR